MSKKEKKYLFNQEIDGAIDGFALVFTFISLGILLQYNASIFGELNFVMKIVFITIGLLGFISETSKLVKNTALKGTNDLIIALVLLIILFGVRNAIKIPKEWPNLINYIYDIGFIFILLICLFGLFLGIMRVIYSLYIISKDRTKEKNSTKFKISLTIISQIFGIILIIAQIYDIFWN